jgi:tetratricopeptide (TPR) repeat protein
MRPGFAILVLAALTASPALATPALAQQSACHPPQSSPPRKTRTGSAPQDNPFPEDVSRKAAAQDSSQTAPNAPQDQQNPPASGTQPHSAAQDNPFPEDVSRKAAAAANQAATPPQTPSGVSSSSSRDPDIGDQDDAQPGRHRLPKPDRNAVSPGSLTGIGRAKDDIRVGNFYFSTGDWQGAYARFQEAARDDPTNIDAIFGIAETARQLHHTQEAEENYKMYLEIAPDGPRAKASRKALQDLRAGK